MMGSGFLADLLSLYKILFQRVPICKERTELEIPFALNDKKRNGKVRNEGSIYKLYESCRIRGQVERPIQKYQVHLHERKEI